MDVELIYITIDRTVDALARLSGGRPLYVNAPWTWSLRFRQLKNTLYNSSPKFQVHILILWHLNSFLSTTTHRWIQKCTIPLCHLAAKLQNQTKIWVSTHNFNNQDVLFITQTSILLRKNIMTSRYFIIHNKVLHRYKTTHVQSTIKKGLSCIVCYRGIQYLQVACNFVLEWKLHLSTKQGAV